MAGGVRNSCFARGLAVKPGPVTLYTVPQSKILLLKSAFVFENNGVSTSFNLYAVAGTPTGISVPVHFFDLNTVRGSSVELWMALNAGDRIVGYPVASDCQYWLSGALLPEA